MGWPSPLRPVTSELPGRARTCARGVEALCSSAELRGDRRPWNRTTLDRRIRAAPAQPARRRRISSGGFEPPSPTVAGWWSIPLSYDESSALDGSRTRLTRETAEPHHQARPRACVPPRVRRQLRPRQGTPSGILAIENRASGSRSAGNTVEPRGIEPRSGGCKPPSWPPRAPCESDRRDSNPVRSAGNAVCFRP